MLCVQKSVKRKIYFPPWKDYVKEAQLETGCLTLRECHGKLQDNWQSLNLTRTSSHPTILKKKYSIQKSSHKNFSMIVNHTTQQHWIVKVLKWKNVFSRSCLRNSFLSKTAMVYYPDYVLWWCVYIYMFVF